MRKFLGAALVLAVGLTLFAGHPSFAGAGKGGQRHEGRMEQLITALNLTDDQKAKIKPIMENARQQRKSITSDTKLSAEDKKAKLKALRKDTMSQIGVILTPDQKAKLKQMRHQQAGKDKAPVAG